MGTLTAVDQVGVAIDQARREQRAPQIDGTSRCRACRQVCFLADPRDAGAIREYGTVFDETPAVLTDVRIQGGNASVAPEGCRVHEETPSG